MIARPVVAPFTHEQLARLAVERECSYCGPSRRAVAFDEDGDPACARCAYPELEGRTTSLVGLRFVRLLVVAALGRGRWRCSCTCGAAVDASRDALMRGNTLSCGCGRFAWREVTSGFSLDGEPVTAADYARRIGLAPATLRARRARGASIAAG